MAIVVIDNFIKQIHSRLLTASVQASVDSLNIKNLINWMLTWTIGLTLT